MDKLELAIQNYKLMMGKDTITPIELEILKMMLERQEIAEKLKPPQIRMRKTFFFMRNLFKLEYRTIDNSQRVHFLVSPLTFLFQVFSGASLNVNYDHYKTLHLRQSVEKEFKNCKPVEADDSMTDVLRKQMKKDLGSSAIGGSDMTNIDFKEGNVLELQLNSEGIDLEKFKVKQPNEKMKVSKLEFVVSVF